MTRYVLSESALSSLRGHCNCYSCGSLDRQLLPWNTRRAAGRGSWTVRRKVVYQGSAALLAYVINLDCRADRLSQSQKLEWKVQLERVPAVDGKLLSWDCLPAGTLHEEALHNAILAERRNIPTICRNTGSFSPHLTLPAIGCALSHRMAWERLLGHGSAEWALVCEDDVDEVAQEFERQLSAVLSQLPATWQICYLGFHESLGKLVSSTMTPAIVEIPGNAVVTGLFGYILRKSAARHLIQSISPLRYQIDVAVSCCDWPASSRFALSPDAVLLTSPKSELGACDTDVQTLGSATKSSHEHLPASMRVL